MSVLEVRNLKKSFGKDTVVLKGVDFSLEKGETVAIIGSSGSGKTTLLRCLNFLTVPDEGQIVVNDETLFDDADPNTQKEREIRRKRLHFGLVFQNFNLFPQYTARQNVMLASELLAKEQPDPFRSTTDQRCIMSCAEVYFRLVNQPERDPEKEKTLLELAKTHRRAAWKIPLEHKSQKLQALMVSYCPHLGAKVWKLVRWVKGLKN